MSIVINTEEGWVLDHKRALDRSYTNVNSKLGQVVRAYEYHPDLFEIKTQFLMDSHVFKADNQHNTPELDQSIESPSLKRKKKKKRRHSLNEGEKLALELHEKVRSDVFSSYEKLLEAAMKAKFFMDMSDLVDNDNNSKARAAAIIPGPGDSLIDLCQMGRDIELSPDESRVCSVLSGDSDLKIQPLNKVYKFRGDNSQIVTFLGHQYLIPPECSFLLSDIHRLQDFTADLGRFDLIVLDPPWENKSVKRKKKYYSLSREELFQLPIPAFARKGTLVAMWVTNRHRHITFVEEELFPAWSVTSLAKWHWIKVTKGGQMVYDFDSPHKKPYETLILGQRSGLSDGVEINNSGQARSTSDVPTNKVIVSVPCSLHSKKPSLTDVLQSYLPAKPRCLELFARNLQPGWTSWGNEVLLHQHIDFFKPVT